MGVIITFGVSLALILLLVMVRALELASGKVFFAGVRSHADTAVLRVFVYLRRGIIREVKQGTKNLIVNVMHRITLLALKVTRVVEEKLLAFIGYMRRRAGRNKKVVPPSLFIKTMVDERREEREIR